MSKPTLPLAVPDGPLGPIATPLKLVSIEEAIGWPAGPDQEHQIFQPIYEVDGFVVGVRKPGKEVLEARANPNDMLPTIAGPDGQFHEYEPGFDEIFRQLQSVGTRWGSHALEVCAALICRSAFMLDHEESSGAVRWNPPKAAIEELRRHAPTVGPLPVAVFLHLVEVLALQEDVKFHTLGYDVRSGTGRTNNLLTCAHIAAVFLDRANLIAFAYALTNGRGVAPLSQKGMRQLFPMLRGEDPDESEGD